MTGIRDSVSIIFTNFVKASSNCDMYSSDRFLIGYASHVYPPSRRELERVGFSEFF